MGLSNLGQRKIRRIERRTGLSVEWASVSCHGKWWLWRFWTPVAPGKYRLGVWDIREDSVTMYDEWRSLDGVPQDPPSVLQAIEYEVNRVRGEMDRPRPLNEFLTDPLAPQWLLKLLSDHANHRRNNYDE